MINERIQTQEKYSDAMSQVRTGHQATPPPPSTRADTSVKAREKSHEEKVSDTLKTMFDFSGSGHPQHNREELLRSGEWSTPYRWVGDTYSTVANRPIPNHTQGWKGWDHLKSVMREIEESLHKPPVDVDAREENTARKRERSPTMRDPDTSKKDI